MNTRRKYADDIDRIARFLELKYGKEPRTDKDFWRQKKFFDRVAEEIMSVSFNQRDEKSLASMKRKVFAILEEMYERIERSKPKAKRAA